jgi:hypothetical protein
VVVDDSLMLGLAASYDGRSRLPASAAGKLASAAWGATISVNYNTGPWTVGAYCQYATAEGLGVRAAGHVQEGYACDARTAAGVSGVTG